MPEFGLVVKAYGGFFYIATGTASGRPQEIVEAVLRGKLKKENKKGALPPVLVGDKVDFLRQEGSAVIYRVHHRKTELVRPPIANVDQVVVVASASTPLPDLLLMDKIIALAESQVIDVIIALNKVDVQDPDVVKRVQSHYRQSLYPIIETSAKTGTGLAELSRNLVGRISVLAGPSGVGKSSLLKRLVPGYDPKTQPVSAKSARGRHTTRHVELLPLPNGGYIADTPGFSSLNLSDIELEELSFLFPEFQELIPECKFSGCLHIPEPGCAVKAGLQEGLVSPGRYENYCRMVEEIKAQEKW
ncbi:MAG: ribosome small subunit-dependent GTPase A [Firmicutes bacterium]|nr:ribosome small subunit-dependent GTPase A [Bacillota bacterium]